MTALNISTSSASETGLMYSDIITTVSEKYAQEICTTNEYGYGFEGILKKRKKDLFGILNGVDYTVWNPERDSLIPYRYSSKELPLKREDKKALCKHFKLEYDAGNSRSWNYIKAYRPKRS